MKLILNKKVQNVNALFIIIKAKQISLFNESNEIKAWKYYELKIFGDKNESLVNLEKLWQEKESLLITNINVIKRRFNNSSKRK